MNHNVSYYDNGQPFIVSETKENKSGDIFTLYRSDGQILAQGEFYREQPHGHWKAYSSEGKTRDMYFINGELINPNTGQPMLIDPTTGKSLSIYQLFIKGADLLLEKIAPIVDNRLFIT